MTSYLRHDQLLALVDQGDSSALGAELARHYTGDEAIYLLLEAIKARPELQAGLQAYATEHAPLLLRSLQQCLGRTVFYCTQKSVAEFCALATERARLVDRSSAEFLEANLSYQSWYCAQTGSYEWSDGERGGSLWVESRDVGPAEVIHEDEYRAACWGSGWALRVHYLRSGGSPTVCWAEPFVR